MAMIWTYSILLVNWSKSSWHTVLWTSKDYMCMSEEPLMAWCIQDQLPQMHMATEMRIVNDTFISTNPWGSCMAHHVQRQLVSQVLVVESLCLSSHITWGWSTSEVKTPCLILSTHWPYAHFFSFSCFFCTANRLGVITGNIGVKYSHIRIGNLAYIKLWPIISIGWCKSKGFSRQWL